MNRYTINTDSEPTIVSEPFISKYSSNSVKEFDRIQKIAEQTKGIVMPRLNTSIINVLKVEPHNFNSDKPLVEAQKWAEENLVGIYTAHKGTLNEFKYQISRSAIHKYLQPSATNKSENIKIHLSALKRLPKIVENSIEVEIHADYTKVNGVRSSINPINENILIHRFFGCIRFESLLYRIKLTILEYKQNNLHNKPYTFEVIKIELLDESNSSNFGTKVADSIETDQLSATKILQNVEKSYDKGKFLLEESEKSIDYFKRSVF